MDKYINGKEGYVVMQDGSHAYVSEGRRADFIASLKGYLVSDSPLKFKKVYKI